MALAAMQSVAALVLCGLTLCFAECQGDCEAEDTGLVQRPKYYNYGYYHKDYYHKYYSRRRRRDAWLAQWMWWLAAFVFEG